MQEMEEMDAKGDTRAVHQGARLLSGRTASYRSPQPTCKKNGDMVQSEEELGELWRDFLAGKFSATELEKAREWELIEHKGGDDSLSQKEFQRAVKHMKRGKATGPDGIPVEV